MDNKEFKSLKSTWYKKLKKEGFNDIEQKIPGRKDEYTLKKWSNRFNPKAPWNSIPLLRESKEAYYRLAGFFLHEHEFPSILDQKIWELHCEGLGAREVAKVLRNKENKLNKDNVNTRVRLLTIEMYGRYHGLDEKE